jgi:hypothetical protein
LADLEDQVAEAAGLLADLEDQVEEAADLLADLEEVERVETARDRLDERGASGHLQEQLHLVQRE